MRLNAAETSSTTADLGTESRDCPSFPVEKPKAFVVHGHDIVAREQLELVLHRLGLEPFVLANSGGGG